MEGYTEGLASYVQPSFNIQFSLVEPGSISSEFANSVLSDIEKNGGFPTDDYAPIFGAYVAAAQARGAASTNDIYQTSETVAQVVLDCIGMDKPPLRVRTSTWSEQFSLLKTQADPTGDKLRDQVISTFLPTDT